MVAHNLKMRTIFVGCKGRLCCSSHSLIKSVPQRVDGGQLSGEQVEPVREQVVPPVLLPRVVQHEVFRTLGRIGVGHREVRDVRLDVEDLLRLVEIVIWAYISGT